MKEEFPKLREFGLYNLLLKRVKELQRYAHHKSGIIRFPIVFKHLCRSFGMRKSDAWEMLMLLRDFERIEIVPQQGIRVLN